MVEFMVLYCPVCLKSFKRLVDLKRHFRERHLLEGERFKCWCCGATFDKLTSLLIHCSRLARWDTLGGRCHTMMWVLARTTVNTDTTTARIVKENKYVLDYLSRGITFHYLQKVIADVEGG